MITKQQLIDSLVFECEAIKHLGSKITPQMLDYRPGPEMRTTLELMQYLTRCGRGPIRGIVLGDWDGKKRAEEAGNVTLDTFSAAIDKQIEDIRSVLAEASDQDLLTREVTFPWGATSIMGIGIINTSLKFLTGYKMQLFIYAKQQGLTSLKTSNLWRGEDTLPQ